MPYQRNGVWYTRVRVNGKPIRKAIKGCTNERAARDYEAKLTKDAFMEDCYGIKKETSILFKDFVAEAKDGKRGGPYYEMHAKHKKSFHVNLKYELRSLSAYFGEFPLDKISYSMISTYQEITAKKSPIGVNRHMGILSNIFNLAILWNQRKGESEEKWKLSQLNPTKGVRREQEIPRDVTEPENKIKILLENAANEKTYDVILISFLMGLRIGEIQNINFKKDADLVFTNRLRLPDTKKKNLKLSKNPSAVVHDEYVPIPPTIKRIFEKYAAGEVEKPFDYSFRKSFFNTCAGKNYKMTGVMALEGFHFHDIRHCFSKILRYKLKVHKSTIAELLRHSGNNDFKMTDIYIGESEDDAECREALLKLDIYFNTTMQESTDSTKQAQKHAISL